MAEGVTQQTRVPGVVGGELRRRGLIRGVHPGRCSSAGLKSVQPTATWSSVTSPPVGRLLPCGYCPFQPRLRCPACALLGMAARRASGVGLEAEPGGLRLCGSLWGGDQGAGPGRPPTAPRPRCLLVNRIPVEIIPRSLPTLHMVPIHTPCHPLSLSLLRFSTPPTM